MTLFTDGLIVQPGRNLLDDVASGQFDAAEAAFDQAFFENPTTAARRINELDEATYGEIILPEQRDRGYVAPAIRAEPSTPLLNAEQARQRVKDSGLDIAIEDSGIREGALDILIERKRAERQRKFVLENAPGSTVPIQIAAAFAASAIDPINIASAFVPVVGEARYAAALGRATTAAGRFAARARLGAIEGAAGAALVEPLVLRAAALDQADYDLTDSLANIAFGSILGGGLHGVGGAITDFRRSRVMDEAVAEIAEASPAGVTTRRAPLDLAIARGDDDPMLALRESLDKAISADRPRIAQDAGRQAAEELMPSIRAELEAAAAGRVGNVADLRGESTQIQRRLDGLDDTFRDRAKEYQGQRMTRKEAERAARDAIASERQTLTERQAEIDDALGSNRAAELARADLGRLERGDVPERFRPRIEDRAGQIAGAFDLRSTARARAEAAPWQVRESALRSAVAQAMTGRPVDVEAIFDLADPLKRQDAMGRLTQPVTRQLDADAQLFSRTSDDLAASPDGTELADAEQMLADDMALTQEMADQADIELAPYLKEADQQAADADTYAAAYRAAALCQLRN